MFMSARCSKNMFICVGDDMGLGKTVQIVAFLSGLYDAQRIRTVMIVMPVSVLLTWQQEFERWTGNTLRVCTFHDCGRTELQRMLARVQRRGGVLLTTYGMVANRWEDLSQRCDLSDEFLWDCVILDEGHKIKNPYSKTSKVTFTADKASCDFSDRRHEA